MTFGTLLDQIAAATGDTSSAQRTNARRWLNLTRSHIADAHFWPSALDASASFTTAASSTTGVYVIGTGYEAIYGDTLFNATDNDIIISEGLAKAKGVDVDRSTTGQPVVWAEAGMTSGAQKQIYLWPIPSVATTIEFVGHKRLGTLSAANDASSNDAYFGDVQVWAACFTAGMRFFSYDTDNEDAFSVTSAFARFEKTIEARKKRAGVAPGATWLLDNIKEGRTTTLGRFDPAHFRNV